MAQAHRLQFLRRPRERIGQTRQFQRHGDIFQRRHRRQQMEGLQDDAYPPASRPRQPILVQRAIIDARDADRAAARLFQPRQDRHQR